MAGIRLVSAIIRQGMVYRAVPKAREESMADVLEESRKAYERYESQHRDGTEDRRKLADEIAAKLRREARLPVEKLNRRVTV